MTVQLTLQPNQASSQESGFTCCICAEMSKENGSRVVLCNEHRIYGNVCMKCLSAGPQKAAETAYDVACTMRQLSDRQFHIASKLSELTKADWIDFNELTSASKKGASQ